MKNEITLINPLLVNGKSIKTLAYDADEITAMQFVEAETRKTKVGGGGNMAGAVELDYGLHLYLGFAAIVAVNPDIDLADLELIKGLDVKEVMKIGRNFILTKSEEPSGESGSDEQSETTPVLSILPPENSDKESL